MSNKQNSSVWSLLGSSFIGGIIIGVVLSNIIFTFLSIFLIYTIGAIGFTINDRRKHPAKKSNYPAGAFVVKSAEGPGLPSSAKASAKARATENLKWVGSGRIKTIK